MRLRWKLVMAALVIWLVGVGALWQINGIVVGGGFTRTEATAAEGDGRRVADGVGAMQVALGQLTRLQAVWDDPFQLALDRDAAGFAEVYPPSDMWGSYRARFLLVVDPDGGLIAGGSTDGAADAFGPLPDALADADALSYFTRAEEAGSTCGLWRIGAEGVYTYCTHPVLPTDGSGDPAGFLTMFQPLDQVAIQQLAGRLGLALGAEEGSSNIAPGSSEVTVVSGNELEVRTNLPVNNDPVNGATLVATLERPVHVQAVSTERRLLAVNAAVWAAMLAAVLVAIDRKVLARTRSLSAELNRLDAADPDAGVTLRVPSGAGQDEIDELAAALGRNIEALQARERRLQTERDEVDAVLAAAEAARYAAIDARVEADATRAASAPGRTRPSRNGPA